jgi:hypothetical protein
LNAKVYALYAAKNYEGAANLFLTAVGQGKPDTDSAYGAVRAENTRGKPLFQSAISAGWRKKKWRRNETEPSFSGARRDVGARGSKHEQRLPHVE